MTKNIIFHSNNLCERGVCVSIYDYAFYSRKYLNINPIIVYDLKSDNYQTSVDHFKKEFEVIGYENFDDVQKILDERNIEYFYAQKYGTNDGIQVRNTKNLIHSVFSRDLSQVHGDVYAFISEWMSQQVDYKLPFVPYMINLPNHNENYRGGFGIPDNATVIGRYGGKETFNIDFVGESILKVLEARKDIWFLFLNTNFRINHERCLYFEPVIDLHYKVQFINTCDAFLHARDYGETFGASVLEFACKNKQIISYDNEELQNNHPLGGRNHFLYLKDKCFKYKNKNELDKIFLNISRNNPFNTDYLNQEFSPESVIKTFEEVFIK
jgi:hypothetical protein